MSLIPCPECGREVSTKAEACPHCGCPIHPSTPAPTGPKCYACSATATTKCQRCNELSCAEHVESIYVSHGRGGAYELRCKSCYADALARKRFGRVFIVIVLLIIGAVILFAMVGH